MPGVQTVQDRPGQHAAGAGPGPVQQEVRGGIGHQVPGPSALQEDQEQPRLGHHRGPSPRHPLQEALHLRLPEPGENPGRRRQNQFHHHQVGTPGHMTTHTSVSLTSVSHIGPSVTSRQLVFNCTACLKRFIKSQNIRDEVSPNPVL